MIQASDYEKMVDEFLEAIAKLGDDLCSVLLFGSFVKGTVRPGTSDLLDAVVILQPHVMQDEAAYYRALDVMTDICARVEDRGVPFNLPFHPCHYFVIDPDCWSASALYFPAWNSEHYSRIAVGRDVRPLLRSHDQDFEFMRGWYFAACHQFRRNAVVLMSQLDSPRGAPEIVRLLQDFIKGLPQYACFACNRIVDRAEMLAEINQLFPHEIDIHGLRELYEKIKTAPAYLEHDEALLLLKKCIELNETLYGLVIRWLELHHGGTHRPGMIQVSKKPLMSRSTTAS